MNIVDKLISIIAPENCISCGAEDALLCYECYSYQPELGSICFICQKATPGHSPCHKHQTKNGPDAVFMLQKYEGVIKDYLKSFKFEQKRSAAVEIANYMNDYLPYLDTATLVTWVPTSPSRMRIKGFDHSRLIAKELARKKKLKYVELLSRHQDTMVHLLPKEERQKKIKTMYTAKNSSLVKDRQILLVDDIITTGSTVLECSRLLKKAGAKEVLVVAFAKTF